LKDFGSSLPQNDTEMTEPNSNTELAARTVSETYHTTTTTPTTNTQSNFSGQQMQSISNSTLSHTGDGMFRTASGRSTYHPDGHAPRPTSNGSIGHYCEHEGHQPTPSFNPRGSYGLIPAQYTHSNTQQVEVEDEAPLEAVEKIETSASSDSSTRYGSNGQQPKTRQESDLSASEHHDTRLERIFTTQSQKMTQQISIAQPGDATVDPSSDSFDLSRFLRMFRKSYSTCLVCSRPHHH
jgi:ATP-binding cassette subfamily G (WHITE) protein 2 (PDR)